MSGPDKIKREIEISDISPEELAAYFLAQDGRFQATFFNSMKATTDKWAGAGWCQQCCALSTFLNKDGQETIAKLAEWSAEPYGPEASQ